MVTDLPNKQNIRGFIPGGDTKPFLIPSRRASGIEIKHVELPAVVIFVKKGADENRQKN